MDQLVLFEVLGRAARPDGAVRLRFPAPGRTGAPESAALLAAGDGLPVLAALAEAEALPGRVLATFHRLAARSRGGIPGLAAVPRDPGFLVNGLRPLKLRVIRPGDLVSAAGRDWLLVRAFRPEPGETPADLARARCPVCGMELGGHGLTCQCACGQRFHLEAPEAGADSPGHLNCFLKHTSCEVRGRERRLEEQLLPDPLSLGF